MTSKERLAAALASIMRWMTENGAPRLAENLAYGATDAELDALEAQFGFSLPVQLRELWSIHHGQRSEGNGFAGSRDLYDGGWALAGRNTVKLFLGLLREEDWPDAGITREELASDRWVAFAGRDADLLFANAVSGRVFNGVKDVPPVQLVAESILEWAERYVAAVVADDYRVEEGFGDYYLQYVGHEQNAADAEAEREEAELERHERETPIATQLSDGLAAGDDDLCREVIKRAVPEHLHACVELLLAATSDPKRLAYVLRLVLDHVRLTPEQWSVVAEGGRLLENNAIRNFALARATQA